MCNTGPNVIRKLGNSTDGARGFTKEELLSAFIKDGYGIDKANRRVISAIASGEIIRCPEQQDGQSTIYISVYCPWHWLEWESVLNGVQIQPVRISRDGRVERIGKTMNVPA